MSLRSKSRRAATSATSIKMSDTIRSALIFFGLLLLTVAICLALGYFLAGMPRLVFWLQIATAAVFLGGGTIFLIVRWIRRRRAAAEIEQDIFEDKGADEAAEVTDRMREALDRLKKSQGVASLYDLPWYVIIGLPGTGKTTALKNAGVKFMGGVGDEAVAGFGGTRNCDWYFGEEAILIDTAGRYTSQDSNEDVDQAGWFAILEKLKQTRPKQPINGVIVAVSLDTFLQSDDKKMKADAQTIRARLSEIRDVLRVDIPVYMMFTKADKVYGFREFVSRFRQNRREAVWGTTFETRSRAPGVNEGAASEYDALIERLSMEIVDRLDEESDVTSRIAIFRLAGQIAGIKDDILRFLNDVFEPSKHTQNAILRGFYFTSGTQEGTPIDQVLGEMESSGATGMGLEGGRSGQGAGFFLHDLLRHVIFAERDWVTYDKAAVRRSTGFRLAGLGLVAVATLACLGLVTSAYFSTNSLFATSSGTADRYETLPPDTPISDPDLAGVLTRLDTLRTELPLGVEQVGSERLTAWRVVSSLDPRRQVREASRRAYIEALEVHFRPRLVLLLEQELHSAIENDDVGQVFSNLKAYMLLHGRRGELSLDDADQFLTGWFAAYLDSNPGLSERVMVGRDETQGERLREHFEALLTLDRELSEVGTFVRSRDDVISTARSFLGLSEFGIFDLAYASLEARAAEFAASPAFRESGMSSFVMTSAIRPDLARRVFSTVDGRDLSEVRVDWLYTMAGFAFFDLEVTGTRDRISEDLWVLDEVDTARFDDDIRVLEARLYDMYFERFVQAWDEALGQLQINPMRVPPSYSALNTAVDGTESPIYRLVGAVTSFTRLEDALPDEEEEDGGLAGTAVASVGNGRGAGLARFLSGEFMRNMQGAPRRLLNEMGRGGNGARGATSVRAEDLSPAALTALRIEEHFVDWHRHWVSDGQTLPQISNLLNALRSLRDRLTAGGDVNLQAELVALEISIEPLPEPLQTMMIQVERDLRVGVRADLLGRLNQALNNDVYARCSRIVRPDAVPFGNGSAVTSWEDFAGVFGPNGLFDEYFETYLEPHVLEQPDGLVPAPDSQLRDDLSQETLEAFYTAQLIREAFFSEFGGPAVEVTFLLREATGRLENIQVLFNGVPLPLTQGRAVNSPWNGNSSPMQVIAQTPTGLFGGGRATVNGRATSASPWAIMEFLAIGGVGGSRAASVQPSFLIGEGSVTIQVSFEGGSNPFTMPELRRATCPASLD